MATPRVHVTSEDTPRFPVKGNGGVRSRGVFLPSLVGDRVQKAHLGNQGKPEKGNQVTSWECIRPAAEQLTQPPEGRWPVAVPSGLEHLPKGTWGAFIDFDRLRFATVELPSADQGLAILHAKVAACPSFEKLARPGLTIQQQVRLGKKVRPVMLVMPAPGCDHCSVRNTVRQCQ
jgi:hypothetical protein